MSKLSKRPRPSTQEGRPFAGLAQVNPHAAGIDIGAHENWACVAISSTEQAVKCFGTYTADLHALAAWLREHQIRSVATPAPTAGDMMRCLTRTHENGAYHEASGWCEVDAHWCHEPEPQADPTT